MLSMENSNENLNKAAEYIEHEDYVLAKELLQKVIESDNSNTEAYKNLGLCEINLDNPPDAIKAFEKAVEIDKEDASSLFYLACCRARTGEKEDAVKLFEKVIEKRPAYLDAYNNLAMIYVEFQQIDNAIELLSSALNNPEIEPDYSLYYILSTSYMLKKDYVNASKYLEAALEISPDNISVMNSLSSCYMNQGKNDEAVEILKKALKLDSENSLTLYNLGILYQTMGDYKNAFTYLQKSYNLEPTITMLSSLATCAYNAGEYSLAVTLYQNLVMAFPNNSAFRLSYIECLELIKNYEMALQNVRILLSTDEKNVALIKKKGTLLRKTGKFEDSIQTFENLVKRGKIDVEVYYNMAFNYVELEEFDKAKEMFKKCIILEPNNPYAHKDLGVLYLKMNLYDWALDEIKQAIELEDNVAEFHYSLGVVYMMLSDIEQAKKEFLKSRELDSENADNLAYLGYVYILENDLNTAEEILHKAIKISPDNFLAKIHLAKLYYAKQNWETAKQFLLDAVNTVKDDETMNMLAICYKNTGEYDSASGLLYKLADKYPKNHVLLTDLAECEIKCDKKQQAKKHLQDALMVFDDYEPALKLLEEIS